ncbi:methionyl aminopeptidase [Cetobacterium ceti]|uniref:Methionine aminopeptidase n=1 Tax=Cetobacterium ceti TaxID=180163 RepID=A0A1T4Q4R9_9FUSO|nr:type I methionyl aminopeptidase [Cetobacterium ceti]SJZ98521.1 methionyl aminopeptidase [Cetobacterium ceti]
MVVLKTLDEIKEIKKANEIIARLYEEVLPKYIKAGVSTLELNNIIEDYIRTAGAIPATIGVGGPVNPYPAGSCISVNEEVVHGIPRANKILQEGDIVGVDVVTNLNGYFGDSAITFPVGKIDEEATRLLEVTKVARDIGIEAAVAGNRLGDVGHAIQQYVEKNGFTVVRDFSGHGVGKAMHEDPCIPNFGRRGRGLKIEDGMVLAIEPMVNEGSYKVSIENDGWTVVTRDGKRSAHFEHSIAIIDGKPLILSKLD